MVGGEGNYLIVGRINGLYGVRGWVKVFSHTEPRDNILSYHTWYLRRGNEWQPIEPAEGRLHGKGVVARLTGCDDRDLAAGLIGSDIAILREQLQPAEAGEYYWADLIGLQVSTIEGVDLGTVDHLLETGSNDVLVVLQGKRERLIPFIREQVVRSIDLAGKKMVVDWDPDF
ncbi:MAG TPA: ribosome maturation factor RimM [Gammaproteobacteria bacterium]